MEIDVGGGIIQAFEECVAAIADSSVIQGEYAIGIAAAGSIGPLVGKAGGRLDGFSTRVAYGTERKGIYSTQGVSGSAFKTRSYSRGSVPGEYLSDKNMIDSGFNWPNFVGVSYELQTMWGANVQVGYNIELARKALRICRGGGK